MPTTEIETPAQRKDRCAVLARRYIEQFPERSAENRQQVLEALFEECFEAGLFRGRGNHPAEL